jgi:hypothetical protein
MDGGLRTVHLITDLIIEGSAFLEVDKRFFILTLGHGGDPKQIQTGGVRPAVHVGFGDLVAFTQDGLCTGKIL